MTSPVDPPTDLSQLFEHPQGLTAARALIAAMVSKQAQFVPPTEPQPQTDSFPGSCPVPDLPPSYTNSLNRLLTFRDPQSSDGAATVIQVPTDQDHEMPDKSHVELTPTAATRPLGPQADPFSNIGEGQIGRPPTTHHYPLASARAFPGTSSQTPPLGHFRVSHPFPPLRPSESGAGHRASPLNSVWGSEPSMPPRPSLAPMPPSIFIESGYGNFTTRKPSKMVKTASSKPADDKPEDDKPAPLKRKRVSSGEEKKSKVQKLDKPKEKKSKPEFDATIYMRILEFTPPSFLSKARLISKEFKGYVDQFTSIYVNCRKENFGFDMPPPPKKLTERQYSRLLGGTKGCFEPGCDDKKATRTHWSWCKIWCSPCWKKKVEREDRVMKGRGHQYSRETLAQLLECIPVGMHDSFNKPHDYVADIESRPRGAPRLYKYYLGEDINRIISEYEALTPPPYSENPNHTPSEKAAALTAHQSLMEGLDEKRLAFFAAKKAENEEHMAQVQKIEAGIRSRRVRIRNPYDDNRNARKKLFLKRAHEDLPHIKPSFVESTQAYKAATRIFRDPGSERGWLTLKPKIIAEWENSYEYKHSRDGANFPGDADVNFGGDGAGDARTPSTSMERVNGSGLWKIPNPVFRPQFELFRQRANTRPGASTDPQPAADQAANYNICGSSSSFPTCSGSGSGFFTTIPFGRPRLFSSSSGQFGSPQPLSSSNLRAPLHYLSPPAYMTTGSSSSQNSAHNPSTQISITSLLRPPTPTTSQQTPSTLHSYLASSNFSRR